MTTTPSDDPTVVVSGGDSANHSSAARAPMPDATPGRCQALRAPMTPGRSR
jgi:hypothetical protein